MIHPVHLLATYIHQLYVDAMLMFPMKENILKINDVFKLHVNLFMYHVYDYRQNHLPESFSNFFPNNLQRNPDNGRRPNTFYCERPQTKFTSTLPKHNFPKMWNNTVANIKELEIKSRQQFKTAMIKNLLQSYQTEIQCQNTRRWNLPFHCAL